MLIEIKDLSKIYHLGEIVVNALKILNSIIEKLVIYGVKNIFSNSVVSVG